MGSTKSRDAVAKPKELRKELIAAKKTFTVQANGTAGNATERPGKVLDSRWVYPGALTLGKK